MSSLLSVQANNTTITKARQHFSFKQKLHTIYLSSSEEYIVSKSSFSLSLRFLLFFSLHFLFCLSLIILHLWFPFLRLHEAETRTARTLKQELHACLSVLLLGSKICPKSPFNYRERKKLGAFSILVFCLIMKFIFFFQDLIGFQFNHFQ